MPTVEASDRARHEGLLRRLLPSASDDAITSLLASAEPRVVARREPVLEPADSTHLMLLLDGFAAVEQESADGRRAIISIISPAQFMGLSRIRGEPSPNRIVALTSCAVLAWPREELDDLAGRDVGVANDVIGIFSRTLHYIFERIEFLAFARSEARIAIVLLEHADLWFGEHAGPRPALERRDLAALAMVSREMVGRVMRRWEQAGVVRRRGPHAFELLDRAALEREAESSAIWREPRQPIAARRAARDAPGAGDARGHASRGTRSLHAVPRDPPRRAGIGERE